MILGKEHKIEYKKSSLIDEYLYKIINIYSAIYIKREFWLTDQERMFYIGYIEIINSGKDVKSKDALEIWNKYLKIDRRQDINLYFRKLVDKNWVKKVEKKYVLPPFFSKLPKKFNFNIDLEIDGEFN
jgi:hypothetical protein